MPTVPLRRRAHRVHAPSMGNAGEPTTPQTTLEEQRKAHVATYAENARRWWNSPRRYYITQFSHGGTSAGMTTADPTLADDVPGLLAAIEDVGWVLYDIGYVYQPVTQRSNILTDSANLTGRIIGIYTFKRPPQTGGPDGGSGGET